MPLVVFLAGAVVGLALFSQLLYLALQRYHDVVLAVLIGLMAGSVRVLWPWPSGVDSTAIALPEGDWLMAVALGIVGFAVVVVVGYYAQQLEASEEASMTPAEPEAATRGAAEVTR